MGLLTMVPALFGVAVLGFVSVRLHALAVRAPLAAATFARAVEDMLARGDGARATSLCDSLRPAWGAELAGSALAEIRDGGDARAAIDEVREQLRWRVDADSQVLYVLARIAIPLSLAIAIVQLGIGFARAGDAGVALASAQAALDQSLRVLATGVVTAVFCRVARAALARLAGRRFDELRIVSVALLRQMSRTTR